jgi:hypothetical protein
MQPAAAATVVYRALKNRCLCSTVRRIKPAASFVPADGELHKAACGPAGTPKCRSHCNRAFSVARHFFGFFLVGARKKLVQSQTALGERK